jgi:hypothetical protein
MTVATLRGEAMLAEGRGGGEQEQRQRMQATTTTTTTTILSAAWPAALPHPECTHYLSVSVGNSRCGWALHDVAANGAPTVLWRYVCDVMRDG